MRAIREFLTDRELRKQPSQPATPPVPVDVPAQIDHQARLARSELAELDARLAEIQRLARQTLLLRGAEVVTRREIPDA